MTAWVAVGLIGGGTAFASRLCSLSRLIGAGMIVAGGVVLAAPAFAAAARPEERQPGPGRRKVRRAEV